MLKQNVGYNASASNVFGDFDAIGREGTYITDFKAIFPTNLILNIFQVYLLNLAENRISYCKISILESNLGLIPDSLSNGVRFTQVNDVLSLAPRSPLVGNSLFIGPGRGLPTGAPKIVVNSVSTNPWPPK